jgi:hypothetical protein
LEAVRPGVLTTLWEKICVVRGLHHFMYQAK